MEGWDGTPDGLPVRCMVLMATPPEARRRHLEVQAALDNRSELAEARLQIANARIAVMAALNMANDLIHAQARDQQLECDISERLKSISDRVDSVLSGAQQLDL